MKLPKNKKNRMEVVDEKKTKVFIYENRMGKDANGIIDGRKKDRNFLVDENKMGIK